MTEPLRSQGFPALIRTLGFQVTNLRNMELSSIPASGNQAWTCPICPLESTQTDEASFRRHLENIHTLKDNERDMKPEAFKQWYMNLVKEAFKQRWVLAAFL
jgi:hypothetical protein